MTREDKILALTENELDFLIDNLSEFPDIVDFFARGGFNTWSNDKIDSAYLELKEA